MSLALVTGSTGFVGNAVARTLLASGREVRVLIRKNSNPQLLQGLKLQIHYGDLRDADSLKTACEDCDEVYHVAAQYTFFNPDPEEIYASNVKGTHQMLEAALEARVKRVVYTSTVGAVGIPKDGTPGNEETPISLFDCKGHYKRSKFLAEQEALSFHNKGLHVVIVNPSAPIGVRDVKPTPTGKMIVDFLNGKMPAFIDTGLNLVDVEDVAQGHLLAAEKGKAGERYILGNQNLTLQKILQELSNITGLIAPKIKIPYPIALGAAHVSEAIAKLSKATPMIEVEAVQLGKKRMFFDAGKAVSQLGLPQTDVRLALHKAVDWYLQHGYIKEKQQTKISDRVKDFSLIPESNEATAPIV